MSTLVAGNYRAVAIAAQLAETSKGNPQVAVRLRILSEGYLDQTITWYGYFSDAAKERTFKALRTLGWKGDDLTNLDNEGIGDNEVQVVIGEEEYEGKTKLKVQWINDLNGVGVASPMSPEKAKAFAAAMKGEAIASRGNGQQHQQHPAASRRNPPSPPADEPF